PLPASEQRRLEAGRAERLAAAKVGQDVAIESAPEDQDEIQLVHSVDKGELIISEIDLANLFNLKPLDVEPPPALHTIERYVGTKRVEPAVFSLDGKPTTLDAPNSGTGHGPPSSATNSLLLGAAGRNSKSGSKIWRFNAPD